MGEFYIFVNVRTGNDAGHVLTDRPLYRVSYVRLNMRCFIHRYFVLYRILEITTNFSFFGEPSRSRIRESIIIIRVMVGIP